MLLYMFFTIINSFFRRNFNVTKWKKIDSALIFVWLFKNTLLSRLGFEPKGIYFSPKPIGFDIIYILLYKFFRSFKASNPGIIEVSNTIAIW